MTMKLFQSRLANLVLSSAALLLAGAFSAQAQLNVTLTPIDNIVPLGVGTTTTYRATFTNDFTFDLFLNSSFASIDAPLSLDSGLYDNFFLFPSTPQGDPLPQPSIAANGGKLTTDIFTVTTPPNLAIGTYYGAFTFLGGPGTDTNDPENLGELYTSTFQIRNVTPNGSVPEPGAALWILAAGAPAAMMIRRRRRA